MNHRVHGRLSKTGGVAAVRYVPSRRDASEVVDEIDADAVLERDHSATEARLRVEFDLAGDRPYYGIQWWEPDSGRRIGWHADETEPEFGIVHLQIEYPDGTIERRRADHVDDEHPYRTFERRFTGIPDAMTELG